MEVSSSSLTLHRSDAIEYSVGIFTNLTEDHLHFHKTMEAYGDAKAKLFERCPISVLNRDDPAWEKMQAHAMGKVLTYSTRDEKADILARDIRLAPDGVKAETEFKNETAHLELAIPGLFSVYNALAAVLGAVSVGVDFKKAVAFLQNAKSVKGRMEQVPTPGQNFEMLIDFAHTPDALENLLRTVRGFAKGRIIVVFGCGGDRDPYKRPIMGEIASRLSDYVVVTSDNCRTEDPMKIIQDIMVGMKNTQTPYIIIENRREAIAWAMDHAERDDIIVLAGKGHETYQIIGHVKTHLDEREEIAAKLEQMKHSV